MIKVVEVWSGIYAGDGKYECGIYTYHDSVVGNFNIEYEVNGTSFDELLDGLHKEIDSLIESDCYDNEEVELMKADIEISKKFIFTLENGKELVFEL